MHPLSLRGSAWVAACLLGFALAAAAPAAGDKAPPDSKALDRYLYNSLRVVINYGVDQYNAGRVQECYDHFRQSLQDLAPVLTDHPDLQKLVKESLDKVEKDPDWRVKMAARAAMPNPQDAPALRQKAFALRAVFNDIRAALNPAPAAKPPSARTATLWDRLGGEKGVRKVVDDFAELVGADPKVDVSRGGKRKLDELTVADLKQKTVEFISANSGGPLKYTGRNLKDVHKGMAVTNEQFDAAVADFKKALVKNNVSPQDVDAVLRFLETTRKDVVEEKKPAEKPTAEGGTVKGRVALGGKPLAKGTVTLADKDGKAYSGPIAADGTYSVDNVPPGAYQVAIRDGKDVPAKYADPSTSGLTYTIVRGAQTFDIELK